MSDMDDSSQSSTGTRDPNVSARDTHRPTGTTSTGVGNEIAGGGERAVIAGDVLTGDGERPNGDGGGFHGVGGAPNGDGGAPNGDGGGFNGIDGEHNGDGERSAEVGDGSNGVEDGSGGGSSGDGSAARSDTTRDSSNENAFYETEVFDEQSWTPDTTQSTWIPGFRVSGRNFLMTMPAHSSVETRPAKQCDDFWCQNSPFVTPFTLGLATPFDVIRPIRKRSLPTDSSGSSRRESSKSGDADDEDSDPIRSVDENGCVVWKRGRRGVLPRAHSSPVRYFGAPPLHFDVSPFLSSSAESEAVTRAAHAPRPRVEEVTSESRSPIRSDESYSNVSAVRAPSFRPRLYPPGISWWLPLTFTSSEEVEENAQPSNTRSTSSPFTQDAPFTSGSQGAAPKRKVSPSESAPEAADLEPTAKRAPTTRDTENADPNAPGTSGSQNISHWNRMAILESQHRQQHAPSRIIETATWELRRTDVAVVRPLGVSTPIKVHEGETEPLEETPGLSVYPARSTWVEMWSAFGWMSRASKDLSGDDSHFHEFLCKQEILYSSMLRHADRVNKTGLRFLKPEDHEILWSVTPLPLDQHNARLSQLRYTDTYVMRQFFDYYRDFSFDMNPSNREEIITEYQRFCDSVIERNSDELFNKKRIDLSHLAERTGAPEEDFLDQALRSCPVDFESFLRDTSNYEKFLELIGNCHLDADVLIGELNRIPTTGYTLPQGRLIRRLVLNAGKAFKYIPESNKWIVSLPSDAAEFHEFIPFGPMGERFTQ